MKRPNTEEKERQREEDAAFYRDRLGEQPAPTRPEPYAPGDAGGEEER